MKVKLALQVAILFAAVFVSASSATMTSAAPSSSDYLLAVTRFPSENQVESYMIAGDGSSETLIEPGRTHGPSQNSISPDGTKVAISFPTFSGDGKIIVADIADPSVRFSFPGIGRVAWSPDNTLIAHGCTTLDRVCLSDADGNLLNSNWFTFPGSYAGGHLHLDWNPDGTRLLASKPGATYVVDLTGDPVNPTAGTPTLLINDGKTAVWNDDGTKILAANGRPTDQGGDPRIEIFDEFGNLITRVPNTPSIIVGYVATGFISDQRVVFSTSGSFTQTNAGEIWAINIDGTEPEQLGTGSFEVSYDLWLTNTVAAEPSIALYRISSPGQSQIAHMGLDGNVTVLTSLPGTNWLPQFSPDGTKIVFNSNGSVRTVDIGTGDLSQVLATGYGSGGVDWSPDGSYIIFVCTDGNSICRVSPTGGAVTVIKNLLELAPVYPQVGGIGSDPKFSPDGSEILISLGIAPSTWRIFKIRSDGTNYPGDVPAVQLTQRGTNRMTWNPDGSQIAFLDLSDGSTWIKDSDDTGISTERRLINAPSGGYPVGFTNESELVIWSSSTNGTYTLDISDTDPADLIHSGGEYIDVGWDVWVPAEQEPEPPEKSLEEQLAERFEPVLIFRSGGTDCAESLDQQSAPYRPMDVESFLSSTRLKYFNSISNTFADIVASPSVDQLYQSSNGTLVGHEDKLPTSFYLDIYDGDVNITQGCQQYLERYESLKGMIPPSHIYAAIRSDDNRTRLTYWFLYFFNDFSNNHEGDWEHITLDFPSNDLAAILESPILPSAVFYSAHFGDNPNDSDSSSWHSWDETLHVSGDEFRPDVYVAVGSHANYINGGVGGTHTFNVIQKDLTLPTITSIEGDIAQIPNIVSNSELGIINCLSNDDRYNDAWRAFAGRWGEDDFIFDKSPESKHTAFCAPIDPNGDIDQIVSAGTVLNTNEDANGPTEDEPLSVEIFTPNSGRVAVDIHQISITSDFVLALGNPLSVFRQEVNLTIPDATANNPIRIVFRLDASVLLESQYRVYRNGQVVDDCVEPGNAVADPDPCVQQSSVLPDGDIEFVILTSKASVWNFVAEPKKMDQSAKVVSLKKTGRVYSPAPNAPLGTVTITGRAINVSDESFMDLYIIVTYLNDENVALNCDSGVPQAAGCRISIPPSELGADGVLTPGETFAASGIVGLTNPLPLTVGFELWGTPVEIP